MFAAAWLLDANAYAQQECTDNAGCPKGFTCEVTGSDGCARTEIACAPGQECPALDAGSCEVTEYKSCMPGDCTSDNDCAEGMVCFENTSETCSASAGGCSENGECSEPTKPVCETTTEKSCVPRYALPCSESADCGEGFDCVAYEQCASGGSSGGGSGSDPGSAGGSEGDVRTDAGVVTTGDAGVGQGDGEPTCTPSEEKYCEPQEIKCETSVNCPDSWTCEETVTGGDSVSSCTRSAIGDGGIAPDASCGVIESEPTVTESYCVPPYADLGFIGRGGAFANDLAAEQSGGGTALGADKGGEQEGDASVTGTNGDGDDADAAGGESDDGGLCSVTLVRGQNMSAAALSLSVLGLFVLFGRASRRARRTRG